MFGPPRTRVGVARAVVEASDVRTWIACASTAWTLARTRCEPLLPDASSRDRTTFRRSGRALATPAPALRVDGSASHTGERFFALEDLLPIDDHEEHDPTWHATVIGLRSVTFTDGNGLRWKRTYAGPGQFGASRDARACSDRPSSVHAARVTSWR